MSGILPSGLSFTQASGIISGTPTQSGTFSLSIKIIDGAGRTSYQTFTLRIDPLVIMTTSLPTAYFNQSYNAGLSATGVGSIAWSIVSGSLPNTLSLSATTGVISGTTTVSCCTYSFTVRATDSIGQTTQKTLSILAQNPLTVGTTSLGDGTAGGTYFGGLFASGNFTNPLTWSIANAPLGLGVNTSTGSFLTSFPGDAIREGGAFTITATVTDSSASQQTATRNLPLNVYAQDQSIGSGTGTDILLPSTRKIAQVFRSSTPYALRGVQPWQLTCPANATLTARVFPVTVGGVPDDSGSPLATGTLTANSSGFFNSGNVIFATPVSMPQGSKFAIVYSFNATCTQAGWSNFDFYSPGDAYVDDGSGWTITSNPATGIQRNDLPHTTLFFPPSDMRFFGAYRGGGVVSAKLNDGKVFIIGSQQYTEVYNPATNTLAMTASMSHDRQYATATLLGSGKVLVAGGEYWNGSTVSDDTTQLFNPATGGFEGSQILGAGGRTRHTATLLNDGRVLIAGGRKWNGSAWVELQTADIFSGTGTWLATINMGRSRAEHTATLLNNGKVLLIGGWGCCSGSVAEIFDPSTDTFSDLATTGSFTWPSQHTTTMLTTGLHAGEALIVGGSNYPTVSGNYYLNVSTGAITSAPSMPTPRFEHTATTLTNGTVVFVGGYYALDANNFWISTPSVEAFDPTTGTFTVLNNMVTDRNTFTSQLVTTPSGVRIAVIGGWGSASLTGRSMELVTPQ